MQNGPNVDRKSWKSHGNQEQSFYKYPLLNQGHFVCRNSHDILYRNCEDILCVEIVSAFYVLQLCLNSFLDKCVKTIFVLLLYFPYFPRTCKNLGTLSENNIKNIEDKSSILFGSYNICVYIFVQKQEQAQRDQPEVSYEMTKSTIHCCHVYCLPLVADQLL